MKVENLIFALRGGDVLRYHTNPMLEHQTIGKHSFDVAMIVAWLAGPEVRPQLLMAALTHDLAEQVYGDMPAPAKRALPTYECYDECDGLTVTTFREVFNRLEEELLQKYELDWDHTLTEQEARWLKLADAADGCFHCIKERAMGNKLIRATWNNFIAYYWQACSKEPMETDLGAVLSKLWMEADAS